MSLHVRLTQEARALPTDERKRILREIKETELHGHLADLFRRLNPEYWVEVTHGVTELGKDIVIVRRDPLAPDVIGVVVKRGDIRAKTSGDVDQVKSSVEEVLSAQGERISDEILSQIAQSREYDADLKAFVATLKVNKVLVVLVGEMSKSARLRFEKEVGALGQIFDLPWLVDMFTTHYPQVFFEGRAIDYLDALIQQLERDSFYQKAGKNLSECFVEPVIARLDRQLSIDEATATLELRNRRVKLSTFGVAAGSSHRSLLIGDPGSGKSKAAAKLCIDAYRAVLARLTRGAAPSEPEPIPMMIAARKLREIDSAPELLDALLPSILRERFAIGVLIVDGLDEVSAAERDVILRRASEVASEWNCSLLVTSRRIAAFSSAPAGFQRFELLPFELGQAMKLMEKVLANAAMLPVLRDGLEKIQSQIPMQPLSLLLLVDLITERREVPSSITELYDRFLDLVFGRWDQEKGVEVLFEYVIKKRFLASFAYHEFRLKRRLEVPHADFENFVSNYASEYGWDDAKLRDFLKEIERAGVLDVHEEVFFRHRSFLDYFVALYVFDQRRDFEDLPGYLASTYFEGLWTEVAFFYAGLGREIREDILEAIFGYSGEGPEVPIDKLLAGRLLQAGWHSKQSVKEAGVRRAVSYVPEVIRLAREFLGKSDPNSSELYGDLLGYLLTDYSLGSVFLEPEVKAVLEELAVSGGKSREELAKRLALLWASRRLTESGELSRRLARFIGDVKEAAVPALDEARLLLLAGAVEPDNVSLRKLVGRRLRRLHKFAPQLFTRLLPARKRAQVRQVPRPAE